jgi:two-component system response regulator NreC
MGGLTILGLGLVRQLPSKGENNYIEVSHINLGKQNSTLKFPQITGSPMDRTRVVIVDNKAMIRDSIGALLSLHDDIEVVGVASDSRETIEKAQELAPDVVLMDITSPDLGVLEVIRRLKKKNPGVKVLVMTNPDDREQIMSGIKVGAAGCVSKRAPGSELISAIRALHRGEFFLCPSAVATMILDYRQRKSNQPYGQLTLRQTEVLKLIAEGHTSREIADILHTSLKTVQNHRLTMMKKLDIHNSAKLVKYAIHSRLVTFE